MPLMARLMTSVLIAVLWMPLSARQLTYSPAAAVRSLHPYAHSDAVTLSFLGNLYEGLIRRGAGLAIEPGLATHWELIDARRWRFHLREGVRFHNGNAFDADDVVFSAQRARGSASALKRIFPEGLSVEKVDRYTVDFVTPEPEPVLFSRWATWFIVDAEWAKANDAVKTHSLANARQDPARLRANGTGPFALMAYSPDGAATIRASDTWWDEAVHNLEAVTLAPIRDAQARAAALLSGQVQAAHLSRTADRERVRAAAQLELHVSPSLRTILLGMDQQRDTLLYSSIKDGNPFKDRRVREAFYLAIDVEALRGQVMRGFSNPSALVVAPEPGVNGGDNPAAPEFQRLSFDPVRARALLAEAGYRDGFGVGMDCPAGRYENDAALCEAIAAMLASVGIHVQIYSNPRARFFAKVLAPRRDTSFYLFGWRPDSLDAWNPLHNLLGCAEAASGRGKFNLGRYCNPEVDSLADQIRVETEPRRRSALIRKAWAMTTGDIAYIPLHQQVVTWGVTEGIRLNQKTGAGLSWRHVVVD